MKALDALKALRPYLNQGEIDDDTCTRMFNDSSRLVSSNRVFFPKSRYTIFVDDGGNEIPALTQIDVEDFGLLIKKLSVSSATDTLAFANDQELSVVFNVFENTEGSATFIERVNTKNLPKAVLDTRSSLCKYLATYAGYAVVVGTNAEIWVKANDPNVWTIMNPDQEIAEFFTALFTTKEPFNAEYHNIHHYRFIGVTVKNVLGRIAENMYVVYVNVPDAILVRKLNENEDINAEL